MLLIRQARGLDSVVKHLLALGQLASSIAEYHGPTLAVGKGKAWERAASWVNTSSSRLTGEDRDVGRDTGDDTQEDTASLKIPMSDDDDSSKKGAAGSSLLHRYSREVLTPRVKAPGGLGAASEAASEACQAAHAEPECALSSEVQVRRVVDVTGLDETQAARAWVLAVLKLEGEYQTGKSRMHSMVASEFPGQMRLTVAPCCLSRPTWCRR